MTTAAGPRLSTIACRLEAMATAAGRDGIGIVDGEPGAHQAIHVVDLAPGDILRAHLIDQHTHTVLGEDLVPLLRLIQSHTVLQARAATARDEYPQSQIGSVFLLKQFPNLIRRRRRHADQRGLRGLRGLRRLKLFNHHACSFLPGSRMVGAADICVSSRLTVTAYHYACGWCW